MDNNGLRDTEGEKRKRVPQNLPRGVREAADAAALQSGLEAADSVEDRSITLFERGNGPPFMGSSSFMGFPYLESVGKVVEHSVAIMGVPFDMGTTNRPGARYGPRGIREASQLTDGYSFDRGVDLYEALDVVDIGDVFAIPGSIEKTFDQVSKAVGFVYGAGALPVMLGGDHSVGYPCTRGIAEHVEGNVGIIHFDRHFDISEKNFDERMHGTPWFHATDIPNAPAKNLVQIGCSGWVGTRDGVSNSRERGTTVLTVNDVEALGIEKAAEAALEIAWDGADAVYLSFDIDSVDPSAAPGTGTPEPGGFTPREALKLLNMVAREGLCGMEVVEVAPDYDSAGITSLLASRAVAEVLATLVENGHLPSRYPIEGLSQPQRDGKENE